MIGTDHHVLVRQATYRVVHFAALHRTGAGRRHHARIRVVLVRVLDVLLVVVLVLAMIEVVEVGYNDGHWQGYSQHAGDGTLTNKIRTNTYQYEYFILKQQQQQKQCVNYYKHSDEFSPNRDWPHVYDDGCILNKRCKKY